MSAAQNKIATAASSSDAASFVINLCSSTTPMALTYPGTPELKRFSFFVSRRREDGRERFRLHMGYFTSAAEAEEWLALVRDIYPGAWASEAPGRKLRAAQAAAAEPPVAAIPVQTAAPAVPPKMAMPARPAASPAGATRMTPAMPSVAAEAPKPRPAPVVPTLHAPPTLQEPPTLKEPPVLKEAPALQPAAGRQTAFDESNLREVLAELESTDPPALTDTQVLALLEKRGANKQSAPVDRSIRMLKPDDTVTRRVLSDAVQNNAPVSFAVQLQWSVQRIDLTRVPPLAIFSAYTLYTIDGSREGRKWYGLRLGFFSDANSAKQVAQYVRSEFASVAVVPVSPKELEHASAPAKSTAIATGSTAKRAASLKVPASRGGESGQFKLVDDAPRQLPAVPAESPKVSAAVTGARSAGAGVQASAAASTHRKAARDKQPAKPYRAPQTLEETLEILGAGRIEIDNGRGELLNDTSVRHLEVTPQKNSAFGRLLERITERVRKG